MAALLLCPRTVRAFGTYFFLATMAMASMDLS